MKFKVGLVLLAISLLFASCGQKEAPASAQLKIVNVGITNDPSSVSPLVSSNTMSSEVSKLIFMPLASQTNELTFVNRLAESITTDDNVTFTVKINQKVKWSDGNPVTADDVIFAANVYTNPAVGVLDPSTYNRILGTDESGLFPEGAGGLEGVSKIDDFTLTIQTKNPVLPDVFHSAISANLRAMPKHILGNEAPENLIKSRFLQSPTVSNGPLLFREYVPGQYLSLEKNKDYFLGEPKIDILNFRILSGTQLTAQLETGEIDLNFPLVGNIPNDDYDRIRGLSNVRVLDGVPSNMQVLVYNNIVLDNVLVRRAIDLAIDRDGILKNVLKGEAFVSKTPVTDHIQYYNEEAARYTYDPEKAKQLLAQSGWDLSRKIVFLVPTGNTTRERVCTVIAENIKAIGLNIVIEKADFPTTMSSVLKHDFEISMIGTPNYPFNQIVLLRSFVNGWTSYNLLNPHADKLVEIINTNVDQAIVRDAYLELQQLISDDVPVSGVYGELGIKAVNKRLIYGELHEYGPLLDFEKWDVQ
jgi:peptide/nickel transport system substrate-binding protein